MNLYILGIKNLKTVSYHATLTEMGMDSIIRTEIIQVLERDFGIYLTVAEARNLTLTKLIELETDGKSEGKYEKKIVEVTNVLIQHLPNCEISNTPFVELEQCPNTSNATIFVFPGVDDLFTTLKPITQNLKAKLLGVQYNYKSNCDAVETVIDKLLPVGENKTQKCNVYKYIFSGN